MDLPPIGRAGESIDLPKTGGAAAKAVAAANRYRRSGILSRGLGLAVALVSIGLLASGLAIQQAAASPTPLVQAAHQAEPLRTRDQALTQAQLTGQPVTAQPTY